MQEYIIHFPNRNDLLYSNQPVPRKGDHIEFHDGETNRTSDYVVTHVTWKIHKTRGLTPEIPVAHVYTGFPQDFI